MNIKQIVFSPDAKFIKINGNLEKRPKVILKDNEEYEGEWIVGTEIK
jgi:hypothetical protein